MLEEHDWLVPDYYPDFHCKMGACRSACCVGWPVSITMENYFRLIGLECSPDLRRRLDCGMHVKDNPVREGYAQFSPRWDGNCPMRADDGRCALQCECGEGVLPDVCRLYPRGARTENGCEVSCSASCEGVLEMFLGREKKMEFVRRHMAIELPSGAKRPSFFETLGREQDIRLYYISIVQDRAYPLPQRLARLSYAMNEVRTALEKKDGTELDALLGGKRSGEGYNPTDSARNDRLGYALETARRFVKVTSEHSDSVCEYGREALAYFGEDGAEERYKEAKARFDAAYPDNEIFFEHILANHMFFSRFPYHGRPEDLDNEFTALCAVYMLLRYIALGCTADVNGEEKTVKLIDALAASFRFIAHTDFDRYAAGELNTLNCKSESDIFALISL